jgi:hypothetical protein
VPTAATTAETRTTDTGAGADAGASASGSKGVAGGIKGVVAGIHVSLFSKPPLYQTQANKSRAPANRSEEQSMPPLIVHSMSRKA